MTERTNDTKVESIEGSSGDPIGSIVVDILRFFSTLHNINAGGLVLRPTNIDIERVLAREKGSASKCFGSVWLCIYHRHPARYCSAAGIRVLMGCHVLVGQEWEVCWQYGLYFRKALEGGGGRTF